MIPNKERLESASRSRFHKASMLDSQNDAVQKVYIITSLIEVALYTVSKGYFNSGV